MHGGIACIYYCYIIIIIAKIFIIIAIFIADLYNVVLLLIKLCERRGDVGGTHIFRFLCFLMFVFFVLRETCLFVLIIFFWFLDHVCVYYFSLFSHFILFNFLFNFSFNFLSFL